IPSAGASSATFQSLLVYRLVRVPESFRGGCSFGVGKDADLSRGDSSGILRRQPRNAIRYEAHMLLNYGALRHAVEGRLACHHTRVNAFMPRAYCMTTDARRGGSMMARQAAAGATAIVVLANAAAQAQVQHAEPSWKPEANVEFVVGAGAGG